MVTASFAPHVPRTNAPWPYRVIPKQREIEDRSIGMAVALVKPPSIL
jgi:hypothetical protein